MKTYDISNLLGLPPETLRIASQTLDYLESNAKPVIFPGDDFLSSFSRDDRAAPSIESVKDSPVQEEFEELREIVDIEYDDEYDLESSADERLYASILTDQEKRKMDKIQAQAYKEIELERKRAEKETNRAQKLKEKEDRNRDRVIITTSPVEVTEAGK